jgi:hypothetical protein
VPSQWRRRARRPGTLDGLKVRLIDDPAASGAELGRALRILARLMVRNYQAGGDHTAIIPVSPRSSTLTVVPNPRPDHTDEAA